MTRRAAVRISQDSDLARGWRWQIVLLAGSGPTERPVDLLAQGWAPTEALASRRALGAWEVFTSDYPGHYELEAPL